MVHFYDDHHEIVGAVVSYALDGWARGESVVVVCDPSHRAGIDAALSDVGADQSAAIVQGRYISVDAEQTLDGFMVDGSPDPEAFRTTIGGLIELAAQRGSGVRVFGEMVAVLWARGDVAAAVALESLWNELARELPFSLMCAYPTDTLEGGGLLELSRVCQLHSSVVPPRGYGAGALAPPTHEDAAYSSVFVPVPRAVGAVRRFVTGILADWGARDALADAALVSSEMATNAVVHARSAFRVTVRRSPDGVVVAVEDAGMGRAQPHRARPHELGGRGLDIVQAVADRWGCDNLDHGKVVWAEFASAAPTPTGANGERILHAG
jgi:anti-sigma regulatory factor (Ser/Thr protein kinase)